MYETEHFYLFMYMNPIMNIFYGLCNQIFIKLLFKIGKRCTCKIEKIILEKLILQ